MILGKGLYTMQHSGMLLLEALSEVHIHNVLKSGKSAIWESRTNVLLENFFSSEQSTKKGSDGVKQNFKKILSILVKVKLNAFSWDAQ